MGDEAERVWDELQMNVADWGKTCKQEMHEGRAEQTHGEDDLEEIEAVYGIINDVMADECAKGLEDAIESMEKAFKGTEQSSLYKADPELLLKLLTEIDLVFGQMADLSVRLDQYLEMIPAQ